MTNKLKKAVSITLASAILLSVTSVFADTVKKARNTAKITATALPGTNTNTPAENIFKIEGSSKEFIVLDKDESGIYVLAKQNYGSQRAYDADSTQKFDPNDTNNVAYWLNSTLIDPKNELGFPTELIDYLVEYDYPVEAGNIGGDCPYDYSVKSKVTLLSQTEFEKYITKFGAKDAIQNWGWWLRTGLADSPQQVIWASTYSIGRTAGNNSSAATTGFVRPAFRLSEDFFRKVRVDLSSVGENVKNTVFAEIEHDTFECYTPQEIRFLDAKNAPVTVKLGENDEVKKYTGKLAEDENGFTVLEAELKNNPDFSKGLWEMSDGCTLEDGKVILDNGAYLATGAYLNPQKTYELKLDMKLDKNSDKKAVKLMMLPFDADGNCLDTFKDVIILGGERKKQTYSIPVTMRNENTEMVLFVLETQSKAEITSFGIQAINEEISWESEWDPFYIINDTGEEFDVKININSAYSRYYRVAYSLEYYHDGAIVSGETERKEIHPNRTNTINVKLPKMRYGGGVFTIRVMDGNRCAKEFSREIVVYEPYQKRYFDTYSRCAINNNLADVDDAGEIYFQLLNSFGFNKRRTDNPHWSTYEKAKGKYEWGSTTLARDRYYQNKYGWDVLALAAYGNPIYDAQPQLNDNKQPLDTPEELKAYAEFITELLPRYPELDEIEAWNEPNNNGFWKGRSVYEYVNAVKALSAALRLADPDVKLMAGSIDVSKDAMNYSRQMFDYEVWNYIDSFSVHPYYHPQTNDKEYVPKAQGYISILKDHGAWKDMDFTETGWRTTPNESSTPQQAEELVKVIAQGNKLNAYTYIYCGHERNSAADTVFGYARSDWSMRPCSASTATYFNFTGGSEYMGYVTNDGNSNIFLHFREGKPVLCVYDTDENETLSFDYNVEVFDMYGNSLGYMKDIKLKTQPMYVKGVKMEYLKESLLNTINALYNTLLQTHAETLSEEEKALIISVSEDPEVTKHYDAGVKILEAYDTYSDAFKYMMYDYHLIGDMLSKYCAIGATEVNGVCDEYSALREKYSEMTNNGVNSLPFTYELLRNAKTFNTEYETLMKEKGSSVDKAFFANCRASVIEGLSKWAQATIDKEEIEYLGITVCIEPAEVKAYDGYTGKADISLLNYTGKDRVGTLEIYNTEGTLVERKENIKIKNKDFTTVSVEFEAHEKLLNTQMMYDIKFISEGEDYNHLLPVTKLPIVEVQMQDATTTADKLSSVNYVVKNIADTEQNLDFELTLPEGWESTGTAKHTLAPGESKEISMGLNKVVPTAYNYYPIGLTIKNGENIVYSQTELLDFAIITKADSEYDATQFTGDISWWRDAYPYYISPPADTMTREGWHSNDITARFFSKYDDKYIYFMLDVYDETHSNTMEGEAIWNGDCAQIAIDAGNNRNVDSYDGDDFEFAAARTSWTEQIWCHADGKRKETGARDAAWGKIVRNDAEFNTRYIVKVPISEMPPLSAASGKFVNMDIAVADSDLIAVREEAISICGTITNGKKPQLFKSWYFVEPSDGVEYTDSALTSSIFNEKMEE